MNLFLTQSPQIGAAKAYLLRQALSVAAKKANHIVVEQAKEADLVIVFGSSLPNSADLVGKKVFSFLQLSSNGLLRPTVIGIKSLIVTICTASPPFRSIPVRTRKPSI